MRGPDRTSWDIKLENKPGTSRTNINTVCDVSTAHKHTHTHTSSGLRAAPASVAHVLDVAFILGVYA